MLKHEIRKKEIKMKRLIKGFFAVCVMMVMMTFSSFAAGWTVGEGANSGRWWYDLGNGQYYGMEGQSVEWQWLDGNADGTAECYAFDSQGWMYADTTTPDGFQVNHDGAWVVDEVVQTMAVTAGYAGSRAGMHGNVNMEEENKILIAYFSRTGTTKEAAREIQTVTGGDLFEIEVANPYPSSYQAAVDRARQELDGNARPELSSYVENMGDYEVIILGYPIWWHTAPMAVDTFLEAYDLTGKTILPFCTSGGGSIEESMADIRRLSQGANVGTGLTANSLNEAKIRQWLSDNGM